MKWWKRWRSIGYRELWHLHFGELHEGDKGCEREYEFLLEASNGWRIAYDHSESLLLEAEQLLKSNGIEPPREERRRRFAAQYKAVTEATSREGW